MCAWYAHGEHSPRHEFIPTCRRLMLSKPVTCQASNVPLAITLLLSHVSQSKDMRLTFNGRTWRLPQHMNCFSRSYSTSQETQVAPLANIEAVQCLLLLTLLHRCRIKGVIHSPAVRELSTSALSKNLQQQRVTTHALGCAICARCLAQQKRFNDVRVP